MKEDFDFVTMDSYNKDMSDLASLGASAVSQMKEDLDEAHMLISCLIRCAGKIEIPRSYLYGEKNAYEVSINPEHDTVIYKAIE